MAVVAAVVAVVAVEVVAAVAILAAAVIWTMNLGKRPRWAHSLP